MPLLNEWDVAATTASTSQPKPTEIRKKRTADGKPPYSFIALIAMAIQNSPQGKCTSSEICKYIAEKFAYYRNNDKNWQDSIRHNLSKNECFVKLERLAGRNAYYWTVDDAFRDMFVHGSQLRRKYRFKVDCERYIIGAESAWSTNAAETFNSPRASLLLRNVTEPVEFDLVSGDANPNGQYQQLVTRTPLRLVSQAPRPLPTCAQQQFHRTECANDFLCQPLATSTWTGFDPAFWVAEQNQM